MNGVRDLVRRGGTFGAACVVAPLFAPWIALTGSLRRILLAIILLDIPLQIDSNFDYREEPAELGALGGFNVSLTTLMLTGLYVGWVIEAVARRGRVPIPSLRLVLPLALYVLFVVVSVVTAQDLGLYARGAFLILQVFFVFVYLTSWIRTREDVRFVVTMLLCGLLLESAIILIAAQSAEGFALPGLRVLVDRSTADLGGPRFYGSLGSPINAAAYLEMLLAPAVAVLATRAGRFVKIVAVLGLGLGSIALIGTLSRASWVAAALSIAVTCLAFKQSGRRLRLAIPFVLMIFIAGVVAMFQSTIATRLTADDVGSARARVPLMVTALEIIGDHPELGVGVNNYVAALPRYESTFPGEWLYTVHNRYLLVAAETGLGGLLAFLWFLAVTIRRGWVRWRRSDVVLSPLALGLTAAFAGQMLHMLVDIFNSRSAVQLLWVVAALIAAMSRIEASRPWTSPRDMVRAVEPRGAAFA
jgi:putative inorganic carbon (HCO3(-)) transporter